MEKTPLAARAPENFEYLSKLRELVEGTPDAIFTIAGAMRYNEPLDRYESGNFSTADENSALTTGTPLATGGKDRVLAVACLHEAFPEATIVTLSRTRDVTKPTYAEVAKGELVRRGIDPEQIRVEDESVSTITELKTAARLWSLNRWTNLVLVSSNWHLPRVEALLNHLENFAITPEEEALLSAFADAVRQEKVTIQFIGSTEILSTKSDKYKRFFTAVSNDPRVQERVKVEQGALALIATGHYGDKAIPKKIWDSKI